MSSKKRKKYTGAVAANNTGAKSPENRNAQGQNRQSRQNPGTGSEKGVGQPGRESGNPASGNRDVARKPARERTDAAPQKTAGTNTQKKTDAAEKNTAEDLVKAGKSPEVKSQETEEKLGTEKVKAEVKAEIKTADAGAGAKAEEEKPKETGENLRPAEKTREPEIKEDDDEELTKREKRDAAQGAAKKQQPSIGKEEEEPAESSKGKEEEEEEEEERVPAAKSRTDAYSEERRQFRRRRRVRNQILAYAVLVVLIGLIAAGIVSGVKFLTSAEQDNVEPQVSEQQTQQEKIEEIFADEESISEPESTEPSPVIVEPTYEEKLDALVEEVIGQMTLEDKVAGLFVATPENITGVSTAVVAGDTTKNALLKYPVGGILYQSKNIRNQEQITEMLSKTAGFAEESGNHNIFLAVSEEGGDAVNVSAKGLGVKVDAAQTIGETNDPENAHTAGATIGEYLADIGFNLDFAPVADLNLTENSAVGKRSYGSDPAAVSQFVTAMMQGLKEKGVLSAVIQFPGTGSTTAKTENGLSSSSRTKEEFSENEFTVFQAAIDAGADMIMVSHMSAPSLDDSNTPCSMSEAVVTGILRREMGFQGVIISEPMNRKAVSDYYDSDEAAVNALKAGCDMILAPENFEKAYNGVLEAVRDGRISEERINDSLKRVYRIKYAGEVE